MNRKFVSYSLLLLAGASAVTFTGCKKGSEDPFISFKARSKRLAGTWNESKITTKGFDANMTVNMPEMTFTEDGDVNFDLKLKFDYSGIVYTYTIAAKGKWEFNDKKDVLTFKDLKDKDNDPIDMKMTYDIIGLSSKDLHIDGDWTDGTDKYEVDWTATKK